MKHIGLFEGIGGFSLAARWMGWETIAWCEINPFCQKVLKHHFPKAQPYEDIKTTDFTIYRGQCDILTGGFPCQNASIANQSNEDKGLSGSKTGLWKEMCRAIGEIKPKYVVAENVSNILKVNGGTDFSTILTELSSMGYNAEWRICYASEQGAPHKRGRLYLVAYPDSIRIKQGETFIPHVQQKVTPFEWRAFGANVPIVRGGSWNSEPPIPCVVDGVSNKLVREQIKAFGNSVVPEIPLLIYKAIEQFESLPQPPKASK